MKEAQVAGNCRSKLYNSELFQCCLGQIWVDRVEGKEMNLLWVVAPAWVVEQRRNWW